jgi:hypothetical protein
MTTAIDRAEINRRNAARSTGPRTPEGKSRSRFNAVKHGCRARLTILPGEDPDAYRQRLDGWIGKFRPDDDVELYLVERAVHVSWQLDRADRAEVARLEGEIARDAARRAQAVAGLGAELFRAPARGIGCAPDPAGDDEPSLLSWPFDPDHPEYPAHIVAKLEATAAGCTWLLEKWAALGRLLDDGRRWQPVDRLRAIRLLGKQPLDAIADEQLVTIYLACHAMDPDGPDVFAEPLSDLCRPGMEARRQRQADKFAARRAEQGPRDAAAGRAALRAIIAAAVARVAALREVRAAAEAAGVADTSARLSYSGKEAVEWLRKHQATCSRSLYRAFDELRKLRKHFGAEAADLGPTDPQPAASAPADDHDARTVTIEANRPATPLAWDAEPADDARTVTIEANDVAAFGPANAEPEAVAGGATNEASAPAATVPSDAAPSTAVGDVTNEAGAPAEPPPVTTDQTNEASAPAEALPATTDDGRRTTDRTAEGGVRLVPAVPAIIVAWLALFVSAGLAAAVASRDFIGRDPSAAASGERQVAREERSSRPDGPRAACGPDGRHKGLRMGASPEAGAELRHPRTDAVRGEASKVL